MTPIQDIFTELSDNRLADAVMEIQEWHETGILCDGVVRELTDRVNAIIADVHNHSLTIVQRSVMEVAAWRFVNLIQKQS